MKHIGIDLGTTNSLVAIKKIKTEILPNSEKTNLTRSCVILRTLRTESGSEGHDRVFKKIFSQKEKSIKREFVVGQKAYEWMKQDPDNTVVSIKRLMGRGYSEPEIQNIIRLKKLNYKIGESKTGTENSLCVFLGEETFLPEDISAEILKKMKNDAESYLEEAVEQAVITVPAYFNDKQKYATRIAAQKAGFNVLRLLAEPTAAAISFGIDELDNNRITGKKAEKDEHEDEFAKTILVYDFGGGTFDVSILTYIGGQFIEQGKSGDMWLGGDDIDHLLIEKVLQSVAKEYEIDDIEKAIGQMSKQDQNILQGTLLEKVEKAKIELSSQESALIEVLGLLKDKGDLIDIEVEISRKEFEEILEPFVRKSIQVCKNLLAEVNMSPDMIDNYLLIGGTTYIPLVRKMMKNEFGEDKVLIHKEPMFAVVQGAAILAHKLSNQIECLICGHICDAESSACEKCGYDFQEQEIKSKIEDIVYSSSHDYFLRLADGSKHKIIERNMPLPLDAEEIFKTVSDNQQIIHLQFLNLVNEREEAIGDLWMTLAEGYPAGTEIAVIIHIDSDNVFEITAHLVKNPEIKISRILSRGLADEKLFMEIERIIDQSKKEKLYVLKQKEIMKEAVEIISQSNSLLDNETGRINQELYQRLHSKLEMMKFQQQEELSPEGIMNYTQNALYSFGMLIEPGLKTKLERHIQKIEKFQKKKQIREVYQECERLSHTLSNLDSVVQALIEIEKMHFAFKESKMHKEAEAIEKKMKEILENRLANNVEKVFGSISKINFKYGEKYRKIVDKNYYVEIDKGITK